MNPQHVVAIAATSLGLLFAATPPPAEASAEGPGTPQAAAAHAEFLATLPAPPTGAGTVCVIDSGIDTDTDLGPALTSRSAFDAGTPNDTGAKGDDGTQLPKHGTYVAGVIASQIDGVGTNGIWPAAKVMSRRVFGGPTSGATAQDYIHGIDWCINQGVNVKIINLSLSGLVATLAERDQLENRIAVVRAAPYKVNVVAAAGNNGLPYVGYPASGPGVFAVGATDAQGAVAPLSNRGAGLDISTFGSAACLSTPWRSHLALGRGTSYAAPIVSAVLDALRSYEPGLTPDQAESLLLQTADVTSAGRVLNAARAFAAAGVISSAQATTSYASSPCVPELTAPSSTGSNGEQDTITTPPLHSAEQPQLTGTIPDAPAMRAADVVAPVSTVEPPVGAMSAPTKPGKPVVRSVRLASGVLTVKIAGRRPSETAIFTVTRKVNTRFGRSSRTRTFRRADSTLRIKAESWSVIRVRLHRDGVGASPVATAHFRTDLY
jgi:hypothetical protein